MNNDLNSTFVIAIVGAGGLAVTAAWELANSWPAKLTIKIFDGDKIELSNLNRQILFSTKDLGRSKAETLAENLSSKFPNVIFESYPFAINTDNIEKELNLSHAVIDATDSARTSFLLNDYCVKNLKIFSYAGVVGDYGQALLVDPSVNSPCLRCLFGNWDDEDYSSIEQTCQTAGIIGPIAGHLGWIQANSVIEAFYANKIDTELIKVSLHSCSPEKVKAHVSKDCPNACATKTINSLDLTSKDCPQTFILSKLALEQANECSKLLITFKSKENAQKTMFSLQQEGKKVNWTTGFSTIITCN